MNEKKSPADNTAEKQRGRPFPPGVSGNPEGRPLGTKNMSTLLDEAIRDVSEADGVPYTSHIIKRLILEGMAGNIRAIELIFERMDGKVTEKVMAHLTGVLGTMDLSEEDDEELLQIAKQALLTQLKKRDDERAGKNNK